MKTPIQLVQTYTEDDLNLTAGYVKGDAKRSALIYIHGFMSDFYTNPFVHPMVDTLAATNNAVILAQTRGSGMYTEFLKRNYKWAHIGSYYEKLEEAHFDISAWVEFLNKEGYQDIVLAGHSLGTIKVVRYLFEGKYKDKVKKLVLLAPFEKNLFMEHKAPDKWLQYVELAKKQVEAGKGEEIVPKEFEDFAMTYQTFYSWYKQDDLGKMWDFRRKDYNFPVMKQINVPVKVILGSEDYYSSYAKFGVTPQSVLDTMRNHIKTCETVLIEGGDHGYHGYEEAVAKEIAEFI